jgi:cell division protein FtsI/penicillin-binding protein 2
MGAITAEELTSLGAPYVATDTVGQTGIEGAFERQLAGTPGGQVLVTDAQGKTVATATTFTAKPGADVQTSIDPHVELAAEHALDGVTQPAAVVAVQASTGAVLAAVSRPTAMPFDRALEGRYPPGSTFKVVTAADLLTSGLTPGSPATCPTTISVGGRTFHNFEGEGAPNLPLSQAFAISCNTAFIGLAKGVSGASLVTTAGLFGFGTDPKLGLPAFGGRVPAPKDAVEQAATSIGQAGVLASPLQMASVAAAVDSGAYHPPRLVAGSADDTAAPTTLAPAVVAGLRTMMAEVTASGTGKAAVVPGKAPVSGKTGTAEFGTANPPATHAWFIGYQGDIAFAVLVEGGGVGGAVAAPLGGKFVAGL